jgi:hypothetical protein
MTGPHLAAVGTYGPDLLAWNIAHTGEGLRWWQKLTAWRLLEHDATGELIWLTLLLSAARQVGKSFWLRALALWRIHQGQRLGEAQLVLHTGKDLAICSEVQRPARTWARQRDGYKVNLRKGEEEVHTSDGSRWLVRSQKGVYGYSSSLSFVDEAWQVEPIVVEDGLEPTMPERLAPQMVLTSTAHRRATALFPLRRAQALAALNNPTDALLIEWSARRNVELDDRKAWRQASPHWSKQRERLIASKLDRALSGVSEDPDEDDPVESFRSQYLNIWPSRRLRAPGAERRLLDEGVWDRCADMSAELPPVVTVAVEDWFGLGAAVGIAGLLPDERVVVSGRSFVSRVEAFTHAAWLVNEGCRVLVGASLDGASELAAFVVEAGTAGLTQTRAGLPLIRDLVATGRLVHDGSPDLAGQVRSAWVRPAPSGGLLLSARSGRSDVLRCVAWAAADVLRPAPAVIAPRPRIY